MNLKKNIKMNRPDLGWREYLRVYKVLRSGKLAQGQNVALFEEEFSKIHGARHAIACNSGTSALYLILLGMKIGPGDEVLVPAFTFGATANAVIMTGAKAIFVDVDLNSCNMNHEDAQRKIGKNTKAIIVVHLYGNPVDLDHFAKLAETRNLFLIQDAAQAHLAMWNGSPIAKFGDALAFSFYPTKNMTTIEGGMVLTNNMQLAQSCSILRNQGMSSRYEYELPGLNLRMTEVSAAIGLEQLRKIIRWTERRIKNARDLRRMLTIQTFQDDPRAKNVYHQFTLQVTPSLREPLRQHLKNSGIESDVYYPQSLTTYRVFDSKASCPNSDRLASSVISIPIHHRLSRRKLKYLASTINSFFALDKTRVNP